MPDTATSPSPSPYRRPRSLAGPVVLIAIGVVFLLVNLRIIGRLELFHWFARYWPLLIILWGAVKLIEYIQDRSANRPTRGVGAGGFILLFFLIIIGLSFSAAERFNWSALRGEMDMNDDFMGMWGNTYEYSQTVEQQFPANASLRVVSDRGDINVVAWDQPQIKVVVHKKVVADTEDKAKSVDQTTQPVITTEGTVVTLNANTSGAGDRPVRSDLEVYVPKKAGLDLSTRQGDLTVRDREGDIRASTHGDVTLEGIKGSANLSLRRGSVQVSQITGDVSIDGRVDDVKLSDVSGAARLSGDFFGDNQFSRVAKGVSFRSSRTDMQFTKLDGDLTLGSGEIRGTSLTGPLTLMTKSKDIHLDDVVGPVKLENSNGTVDVHAGKLPLGNMEITNRNGDISVVLPEKAAFQVDASALRGDINSDYPGLKIDTNTPRETKASGVVGSGGARLQINNEHGNIDIRKAG